MSECWPRTNWDWTVPGSRAQREWLDRQREENESNGYLMESDGHVWRGLRRVEQWVVLDTHTWEIVYGPGPEKEVRRYLHRAIARYQLERRERCES